MTYHVVPFPDEAIKDCHICSNLAHFGVSTLICRSESGEKTCLRSKMGTEIGQGALATYLPTGKPVSTKERKARRMPYCPRGNQDIFCLEGFSG